MKRRFLVLASIVIGLSLALGIAFSVPTAEPTQSIIVQGTDAATVAENVRAVGGSVTHELGIIHAVVAELTTSQRETLDGVRFYENSGVRVASIAKTTTTTTTGTEDKKGGGKGDKGDGGAPKPTYYPESTTADKLHAEALTGDGVAIAVIDSGMWKQEQLLRDSHGVDRLAAVYDARVGKLLRVRNTTDTFGHGSHVTSVAASCVKTSDGKFNGLAPDAEIVSVVAFDDNGEATYGDVIRGIDWVVQQKDDLNIRVMNLSFSAAVQSHYWDDPLNQAVMRAWQSGIVVVASAGNNGPDPLTIGVPGNVPYIITVGAMSDSYTPADASDDILATFSAAGPTREGFVKPDLLAPGGHVLGMMDGAAALAKEHPTFHDGGTYFTMSGTSQAAAVVSGIVALMLDREPFLTPDDVKCKLLSTARPATDASGALAGSIFQQGAGLVQAYDATYATDLACANRGLDIQADLNGSRHFAGLARQAPDGSFYIEGLSGYVWSDGYAWSDSVVWSDSVIWDDSVVWGDSVIWGGSLVWGGSVVWDDSVVWGGSLAEPMSVNRWVPQE